MGSYVSPCRAHTEPLEDEEAEGRGGEGAGEAHPAKHKVRALSGACNSPANAARACCLVPLRGFVVCGGGCVGGGGGAGGGGGVLGWQSVSEGVG